MKTNQKGFSAVEVLILILVLALIGGAGFYVYKQKSKTDNKAETSQSSQNATKETEEDKFATYKDETTGLSIKHPKEYKVEKDEETTGPAVVSAVSITKSGTSDKNKDSLRLDLQVYRTMTDGTAKTEMELPNEFNKEVGELKIGGKSYKLISLQPEGKIFNVSTWECTGNKCIGEPTISSKYYFNANFYPINTTDTEPIAMDSNSEQYKVFLEMLKSISF